MAAWIANDHAVLERILAPEFALIVSARPEAQVIARYSSYAEPRTASAESLHAATRESPANVH